MQDLPTGFRFHDLRHYLTSLLISSGADVKVVQALLRHRCGARRSGGTEAEPGGNRAMNMHVTARSPITRRSRARTRAGAGGDGSGRPRSRACRRSRSR
ncbi:hypothetical protein [Microbispora sp. KK1-11]|uniref:hypothetical protein n=1 Tax=Microbispora sp. KK1-11 TaxID=2053005 RepID=UPI0037CC69A8